SYYYPACRCAHAGYGVATQSHVHRRPHEVALAELDAAVAQDVVGGGAVEIEVRQDVVQQQPLSGELALVGAELDRDLLVLGAVDLRRLEALDVVDGLGEARLEVGKTRVRAGDAQCLGTGERTAQPDRVRGRLLHLASE